MKKIALHALVALVCLGSGPVSTTLHAAEQVDHLYEALVSIDSAAPEVQELALQQGLAMVLTKISGYSGTPGFPGLDPTIQRAPALVSEFGIRETPRAGEDDMAAVDSAALYMRFVPSQLESTLRQFEIPQWPAQRPQTLVLVTSQLGGRPWLISEQRWPALYAELQHWSFNRGVPLKLLSQAQLSELGLSARAVSEGDELALQVAAELLSVERVAIIQLAAGPNQTLMRLDVLGPVGFEHNAQRESRAVSAAIDMMDQYADELSLANAFVAVASASNQVHLSVMGVGSYQEYRELQAALESIDQVDDLQLVRLQQDQMLFRVQFQSGLGQLQQGLRNLPSLTAMPTVLQQPETANSLQYQWRGEAERP